MSSLYDYNPQKERRPVACAPMHSTLKHAGSERGRQIRNGLLFILVLGILLAAAIMAALYTATNHQLKAAPAENAEEP